MPLRLAVVLLACLVVACSDEPADTAVEVREENVVRVGDLTYRAVRPATGQIVLEDAFG